MNGRRCVRRGLRLIELCVGIVYDAPPRDGEPAIVLSLSDERRIFARFHFYHCKAPPHAGRIQSVRGTRHQHDAPARAEWLRSTDDPSLQKVARGLGLIYTSIVIILLSAILLGVLEGVMNAMGAQGARRAIQAGEPVDVRQIGGGMAIVLIICGLGLIVGYILSLVGSVMCLATPEETGAKRLITTAVVLMIIALAMRLVNYAMNNAAIEGVANLFSVIGGITFIVFLKKLAEFVGADHLARRAQNILVALVIGVALLVLSVAIVVMEDQAAIVVAGFIGLVLIIGGLIVFVMYANLINNLRKAIQSGGTVYS